MCTLSALSIKGDLQTTCFISLIRYYRTWSIKKENQQNASWLCSHLKENRIFFLVLLTQHDSIILSPSLHSSSDSLHYVDIFYYISHIRMTLLIESCTRFMFIRIRFQLNLICDECLCNSLWVWITLFIPCRMQWR
jgi:hypothetical protein